MIGHGGVTASAAVLCLCLCGCVAVFGGRCVVQVVLAMQHFQYGVCVFSDLVARSVQGEHCTR